jgi:glutathione peroxidase-family protein
MTKNKEFPQIYEKLHAILKKYEKKLDVVTDKPCNYYLNTAHIMENKKPMFFGAASIKKNSVSFHLMPVYVNPDLLNTISPELKKCMQGKSCFNFKKPDNKLFKELARLTRAGVADYKKSGYL